MIGDIKGLGTVQFYPECVAKILSQFLMAEFSKWKIEHFTDKQHVCGDVRDLCYAEKIPEGTISKFMPNTFGLHSLQVNVHDADREFGNKIFDNGTKSGEAMCFVETVAKFKDGRSDASDEEPRLSDEDRDEMNDTPFEEDTRVQ